MSAHEIVRPGIVTFAGLAPVLRSSDVLPLVLFAMIVLRTDSATTEVAGYRHPGAANT
jgi:hypothetical protein